MPFGWILICGEYPPMTGGVSDYTYLLALALAKHGRVFVFTQGSGFPDVSEDGIVVRRFNNFGPLELGRMHREIARIPEPRQIVIQYVAQSFGARGLNVFVPLWVSLLRRTRPWVMFHELEVEFGDRFSAKQTLLAVVTQWMAARMARATEHSFVSTSTWLPRLKHYHPRVNLEVVPIPSNMATDVDDEEVSAVRARHLPDASGLIIGHFGTYRMLETTQFIERITQRVLSASDRRLLLIGQRSDAYGKKLRALYPAVADRIVSVGALSSQEVATHLAACDVVVQPYPEGVTTRRTSITAALAIGSAIVTTRGSKTEPIWAESGAVALAADDDGAFVAEIERLLQDEQERLALRARSKATYADHFAIDRTVEAYLRNRHDMSGDGDVASGG